MSVGPCRTVADAFGLMLFEGGGGVKTDVNAAVKKKNDNTK